MASLAEIATGKGFMVVLDNFSIRASSAEISAKNWRCVESSFLPICDATTGGFACEIATGSACIARFSQLIIDSSITAAAVVIGTKNLIF
jgi:hypothetical protein